MFWTDAYKEGETLGAGAILFDNAPFTTRDGQTTKILACDKFLTSLKMYTYMTAGDSRRCPFWRSLKLYLHGVINALSEDGVVLSHRKSQVISRKIAVSFIISFILSYV